MDRRPNPDELLAQIKDDETRRGRGRLKVFFGSAPGVGKTFAMLEAARIRKAEGVDVVVGWAETHGRRETAALLEGQEILPPRLLSYRGRELREFDLDAALERRPALILVDELAHTNAPGSRHNKRWRDIRELLAAGIHVYTTLNVQHLESLHGVVAQITGVSVAERVPDSVFEEADEVEIVDLPADELIKRMKEGKVYFPQLAEQALGNFFRAGNLIALRELALRQTADRVDVQMQRYRKDHAVGETWPTAERVLVCLGSSPYGQHLVRSAKRLADRLRAEWIALYVETSAQGRIAESDREQLERTLRLVEQLGGKAVTLPGENTAEEILAFASARNVTKILLGKPPRAPWLGLFRPGFVDSVIRNSEGIDVYIIGGNAGERLARIRSARRPSPPWGPYLYGLAVVGLSSLVAALLHPFVEPVNLAMVFLLGVVLVATRFGVGPSIAASILSVALFDFLFVPPYLTFAVGDSQYLITFTVMLVVALLISNLAARARLQADRAREAQRRTEAMVGLTQDLARARDSREVASVAVKHLSDLYGAQSAVFLSDGQGGLELLAEREASFAFRTDEMSVARWALQHGQPAGLDTDTLPGSDAIYFPMEASEEILGVVGIRPQRRPGESAFESRHRMEAVVSQTALAMERALLSERARKAQMEAESERLRSALLSSVSHDFRTPLASIVGASSAMASGELKPEETRELAQSVYEESLRLSRFVANLLELTRLESGTVDPKRELQPIEEVLGPALERVKPRLGMREIVVDLPDSLPMVAIDARLMEQLFINLLENAARHTPDGTRVDIRASCKDGILRVAVEDRGHGLPPGSEARVFEKFYRASDRVEGAGLGLAICYAIATAHGGTITASNRPGGGASFVVTLAAGALPAELGRGGAAPESQGGDP
jgi:two-component system sensor histidine kinase KdpD